MDLELLNLDSDGVFAVIDQETATATSAERISYALSNGTDGGTPVWTVKLHQGRPASVASMEIAADTGEVITRPVPPVTDDAPFLTDADHARETDLDPTLAEGAGERVGPEGKVTKKHASPRSRERSGEGPALGKSLVKRVGNPVRLLRRFLP